MATGENLNSPFDSRQSSPFDSAIASPFDSRDYSLPPITPIIAFCDEAIWLKLGDLFVNGADPQWFNNDGNYDNAISYNDVAINGQELAPWEGDISRWRSAMAAYDATDNSWWMSRYDMLKSTFVFILVQPVCEPYFAKGKLPSRGVMNPEAEWGCNILERRVLVKPQHAFEEVQIANHPIFYRRIEVPVAMERVAGQEYDEPAAKWTFDLFQSAVPGGINLRTIEDLRPHDPFEPERKVWAGMDVNVGWFLGPGVPGHVASRSSWLGLPDRTDTGVPGRTPMQRYAIMLSTPGDLTTKIKLTRFAANLERWIFTFARSVELIMAGL